MAMPWKSNWRTKSIDSSREGGAVPVTAGAAPGKSLVELDVLVEDHGAFFVAHDIVAVQAVAELVEIIFALCAWVALGGQDRVADLLRIGAAGFVDGGAEHIHCVIGPGRKDVG